MTLIRVMVLLLAAAMTPAPAGPLGEDVAARCRSAGVPQAACDVILPVEDGLARPGLTAGDYTEDGARVDLEIADFYFRPRVVRVRDGQTVVFTNTNPPGGNRHSLSSSDWGGNRPVLPGPIGGFGGGRAFGSGVLDPGATFTLEIDLATMDPEAYVPLPNGDHVISFFCYIHGSSQMNGQLVVTSGA